MNEQQQLLEGAASRLNEIGASLALIASNLSTLIEATNRNTESNGRLILALAEGVDEDAEPEDADSPQYLNQR